MFSLQPKIRSDIAEWSPELHKTFSYLTDKELPQYKEDAMKVLDILFTKTLSWDMSDVGMSARGPKRQT